MKKQAEIKFALESLKNDYKETMNNNELSTDQRNELLKIMSAEIRILKWVLNEE